MNQPDDAVLPPQVEVRRSVRRQRTVTAYREGSAIVVVVPQAMSKTDERRFVDELVRKLLAREARRAFPPGDEALTSRAKDLAKQYLAAQVGFVPEPSSVTWVTNQQKRWGSCTPSTRAIRLSHRLQAMPEWVVDYVLLHELTHLVEADHTKRFWRLVECYPDAGRARGFLEGFLAGRGAPSGGADAD
jgi:predicted metal-dependent hydrolase